MFIMIFEIIVLLFNVYTYTFSIVLFEFCIYSEFIFHFSFGTFGFWSAYLKPKMGEVVVPNSYYGLGEIKAGLPEWKIISDPCFSKQNFNSSISVVPEEQLDSDLEVSPECLGKEIEYGI